MRVSFLTLPPLKTEYDADHLYIVPRLRDQMAQTVTHLDNAARHYSRAMLIGGAGLGKSSALQYMAVSGNARVLSFGDYHPNALPTDFETDSWILLDDVTEPAHINHLESLAAHFPNAKIWATTRTPNLIPKEFTALELQPFNEREIVSFAEAWCLPTEKHSSRLNRAAQDFVASVQANAGTRELAITPLYLFLLLQVYSPQTAAAETQVEEKVALPIAGGGAATPFDVPQRANISPLPARRAQLFDDYVQSKLATESDPDFAARALEGIALSTKRGQRAQEDHLARGYDFLIERPSGRVEFKHSLLQDFLAARALRRNPDFAPMREHLLDPAWREVILFYAGLGSSDEVVTALQENGDLEMAAAALAESAEPSSALLEQVVKALVARAWDDRDERAIHALGWLRNNQASDFFAAKLRDKNEQVRLQASYILGGMHTDRALEYLLPQLRDPSADVRDQVIASLGASRSERVVEPLLVALRGDPRVASSDTRVKIAAAKALGEYGTDKAVPALIVDLQVGDPAVRAEAMIALEKIRSDFAVKPLESISTTDKHPEVREAAALVLKDMQAQ
ncbi:MAG TPA: HEAT repeat domain-containing protein [Anaerolineae bacterium]|nr:HEAT repeat domain-containing protein [Anaerolineae bacterium]